MSEKKGITMTEKDLPGGKGVGLLLSGWQAVVAAGLPLLAVGAMWGSLMIRMDNTEAATRHNRDALTKAIESLSSTRERLVRVESHMESLESRPAAK